MSKSTRTEEQTQRDVRASDAKRLEALELENAALKKRLADLMVGGAEAFQRLDRLAEQVPGMIYQYHLRADGTGHFPYVSPGIEAVFGLRPEQLYDDSAALLSAIHPDDRARVMESVAQSGRALSEWHEQYRINLPDGQTIWVEGHSTPELASDGGVLWHGHTRDITDRKTAESQLLEQLEELRRWQRAMLDREGRIISMKQEVNELLARAGQPPRYALQRPAASAPGVEQPSTVTGGAKRENGDV